MSDDESNVLRFGAMAPKQGGRKWQKQASRKALEDENLRLQDELADRKQELEMVRQRFMSLGAACHALVLRHGTQVFSRESLEQCSLAALRWGLTGPDRIELSVAVREAPPEGKVR